MMKAAVLLIGVYIVCGIKYCDSFVFETTSSIKASVIPLKQMDGDNNVAVTETSTSTRTATTTNTALLNDILQVAIAASKKAGDIILGNAGGVEITERKANSRDLLTLIDPLCEKVCSFSSVPPRIFCCCHFVNLLFLLLF
jgi:hypothetical protein